MDSEQGDNMVGNIVGNTTAGVVWTNAMSAFVLSHLANLVASGNRTCTGFKKVHHNNCARALNDHLKVDVTGEQVQNHLRKWRKVWAKIGKLQDLSGALWDENTYTIRLEHGHYTSHVKDHRGDADYLNTPLEHYHEMATIFGNSMATGKYAKGANDPIGTDVNEISNDDTPKAPTDDKGKRAAGHGSVEEATMSATCGGDSSASKPPKRAKISTDDDLYSFMTTGIQRLAKAIEKAGTADTDVPGDLWDNMMDLPGFEEAHLTHYYAHLCENVSLAWAFNKLSFSNKIVWVARYISNNNL